MQTSLPLSLTHLEHKGAEYSFRSCWESGSNLNPQSDTCFIVHLSRTLCILRRFLFRIQNYCFISFEKEHTSCGAVDGHSWCRSGQFGLLSVLPIHSDQYFRYPENKVFLFFGLKSRLILKLMFQSVFCASFWVIAGFMFSHSPSDIDLQSQYLYPCSPFS